MVHEEGDEDVSEDEEIERYDDVKALLTPLAWKHITSKTWFTTIFAPAGSWEGAGVQKAWGRSSHQSSGGSQVGFWEWPRWKGEWGRWIEHCWEGQPYMFCLINMIWFPNFTCGSQPYSFSTSMVYQYASYRPYRSPTYHFCRSWNVSRLLRRASSTRSRSCRTWSSI